METQAHITSIVASVAAFAAALGVVPRLGPGRALALGLASRLFRRAAVASARTADVAVLRSLLAASCRGQYIVVAGPKGVGKSCAVASATQLTSGVVTVRVPAGTSEPAILSDVFTALTRYYVRSLDQSGSARRVLWWHELLFRVPATVVLQAAERKPAQAFADLDSAARALAGNFGVRVVIDASTNSLPDAAIATLREMALDVEPMPRATLEGLADLSPLLSALRAARVDDVVWACVGGVPAAYIALRSLWAAAVGRAADTEHVATAFAQDALGKAIRARDEALAVGERLAPSTRALRARTMCRFRCSPSCASYARRRTRCCAPRGSTRRTAQRVAGCTCSYPPTRRRRSCSATHSPRRPRSSGCASSRRRQQRRRRRARETVFTLAGSSAACACRASARRRARRRRARAAWRRSPPRPRSPPSPARSPTPQ